jgi:hypothetical protein
VIELLFANPTLYGDFQFLVAMFEDIAVRSYSVRCELSFSIQGSISMLLTGVQYMKAGLHPYKGTFLSVL